MSDMACRPSIYDNVDTATLQQRLSQMTLALLDLEAGGKVVTVSYAQGDGSRSVTYSQADRAGLRQTILEVQSALDARLGVRVNRRAPIVPFFTR